MTERPVILITGASGFLASRLVPLAAERATVMATSRRRPTVLPFRVDWQSVDLRNQDTFAQLVTRVRPSAVIHAAAANPGPDADFEVNVAAAATVSRVAAAVGARLVHVSSDIVHSGADAPYGDEAEPDPVNAYGHSKADAEATVLAAAPESVVVRTSLIYGLEQIDRGTAGFAERLEAGETLSLWGDAIRQPVWIDALADNLLRLALDHPEVSGTMNVAGAQTLSRADFGRRMLEYWGVDTSNVVDGSAADVPGQPLDLSMTFARARDLGLRLDGVDQVLGFGGRGQNELVRSR